VKDCVPPLNKLYDWINDSTTVASFFPAPVFTIDAVNGLPTGPLNFALAPVLAGCDVTKCCCADNSGYSFLGSASLDMLVNTTTKQVSVVGHFLSRTGKCAANSNGMFTAERVLVLKTYWYSPNTAVDSERAFLVYPNGSSTVYNALTDRCLVNAKTPPGPALLGVVIGVSCFVAFLIVALLVFYYHRRRGQYEKIN